MNEFFHTLSAQVARMPEGIAPRLRPDGEAVGLGFNRDAFDAARCRVDGVDDVVEAAGKP